MHSSPLALSPLVPRPLVGSNATTAGPLHVALARAAKAAGQACDRLADDVPERTLWIQHSGSLLDGLRHAMAHADADMHEAIAVQLDDIAEASADGRELLRRLILLASHARNLSRLCDDAQVPAAVRRRGRALQFRLFDRLARVRRDPQIERLARRRNEVFVELGLRPRSLTLLDWCDVAVRIAQGSPLRDTLATLSAAEAERVLAAKVRFDLLAIELNIALDDLADHGRDAGLFALTVDRVLGRALGGNGFCEQTEVGRYFLEQLARAELRLRSERADATMRYLELIDELYCELVRTGRALVGERWDDATWSAQVRRIIGAMMLSLVQNERPALLSQADWPLDFHGPDRLAVQAANSNRVVFELVGFWCHERIVGQRVGAAAESRLLAVFEQLQIAQQLSNCLATLDRELDEGDRSNSIVERAVEVWRELSAAQRLTLVHEAGLARCLSALSVSACSSEAPDALYERLHRRGAPSERAMAIRCLRGLVDATGAVRDVIEQWSLRVDSAADALQTLGFCGQSSRQAQIDLLVLHLVLLKQGPLAHHGERL